MRRLGAALGWAAVLSLAPAPCLTQQPDPAEAYGIHRPAPPLADSTPPAAGRPDSASAGAPVARDSTGPGLVRADSGTGTPAADTLQASSIQLELREVEASDTSLTARMDVTRGGGLSRGEFPDLKESATFAGRYRTFVDLMERAQLDSVLTDTTLVTLLAPTDSAFAALPPGILERLRADSTELARWSRSVVIDGDRTIGVLIRTAEVVSRGGMAIAFDRGSDGVPRAGEARVVQPDVQARNGILHGLDRVILPAAEPAGTTSAIP